MQFQEVIKLLGHPEKKFSSIHVAGTNGKGSVCLKIAHAIGDRCGLYTSPHLFAFEERIRIGGEPIPEKRAQEGLARIRAIAPHLTLFEMTTLLAFEYFAEQSVDIAVIEVGLGGRLDATNVITPLLSIITSIGLDHQDVLGSTIEEIAREKAGIIKPNVPVILGPTVPPVQASRVIRVQGHFPHYGLENKAIAKAALDELSIIPSNLDIEPPCRFEQHKLGNIPVIFDVAHNPQGLSRLIERLHYTYPNDPYHFLIGISASKDIASCAHLIKSAATSVHVLEISHPRLASLTQYFSHTLSPKQCLPFVLQTTGIVVVCGSFFIMQPMYEQLAIKYF